jgi:adenylate cyclase
MASDADFERRGLLDQLEAPEREARLELLRQLADAGVSMDELVEAVAQDRLALLPIQTLLDRNLRYTLSEYSELTGLSEEFLRRDYLALGLPAPEPGELFFSADQAAAGQMLKQVLDSGVSEESFLELAHHVGRASAVIAEAMLQMVAESFVKPGDTELDLGLRLVQVAEALMPMAAPLAGNVVQLHMRHLVKNEVIDRTTRATGKLPASREISVCFADLVGYTRLGEEVGSEGVGRIASRFATIAAEAAKPPVRVIKLIGDAAMLVSRDTDRLLEATWKLIAGIGEERGFPPLRAGIARGGAFRHAGDWYGRPVNLASRITAVAPPGDMLATGEVRDVSGDGFRYEPWKAVELKGIDEPVELYRVSLMSK